jgi:hypothetical protein
MPIAVVFDCCAAVQYPHDYLCNVVADGVQGVYKQEKVDPVEN